MKTNVKNVFNEKTAEGAAAARLTPFQQLRRSVMTCMLWEDSAYESGASIADRIAALVPQVPAHQVAGLALAARVEMKLRHIPLFLCVEMLKHDKHKGFVADTLSAVIQRPDEMAEFLALYSKGRTGPKTLDKLANQAKKGLARAFNKFDEYQLAKYNQKNAIKLRDVLFLCHACPKDELQRGVWRRLIEDNLKTPDTWEVELSASPDKCGSWTRLLLEGKLGALALLRNLRNMTDAKVPEETIIKALRAVNVERALPFRFITAARYAPGLEPYLEEAMLRCLAAQEKLPGKTVLVVDVSGSMASGGTVSKHSELSRLDAACGLAMLIREVCEQPIIFATAGSDHRRIHATARVPARRGFALADLIRGDMMQSLGGGGIFLKQCLDYVHLEVPQADRVIVLTDEQDCDLKCNPATADAFGRNNYLINVSAEKNGIGYGKWTHIDGWSEAVIQFIQSIESEK
jgi:hypothetical protein